MSTVGKVNYDFTADTTDLDKKLRSVDEGVDKTSSKSSQFANKMAGVFKAAFATASIAVAGLATAAVKSYADYEQLTGGIETLFKGSADQMFKYADQAYKTAGMSANQYMETATSFSASLIQGLGGDTAKAAEYANMAITDMSDNANKMGTSMESIQFAYQGFAKQNYTMLDNLKLGYGGTKEEMQRLLKDAEKMPEAMGRKFNLNNYADVVQAINVVQQHMGIAGTTAKEASSTISGSFNSVKASWSNLLTALVGESEASTLSDMMPQFVESVKTFAGNIMPVAKTALEGIVSLVTQLAPIIIAELPGLLQAILPPLIAVTVELIVQLIAMLPSLLQTLTQALLQALPVLIEALVKFAPQFIQGVIGLIGVIAAVFSDPNMLNMILQGGIRILMMLIEALPRVIEALSAALPTIINTLVAFLTNPQTMLMLIKASVMLFLALVKAVPLILGGLLNAFGALFGSLWNGLGRIFTDFAGKFGNAMGQVFKNAINGVLGFIENFINGPIDLINLAIGAINAIPGVNIGKIPRMKIPRFETGGIVGPQGGGSLIWAGDGGENEWIVPESKMASLIDKINSQTGGTGGNNYTINVSGTFATSPAEQRKVAELIREQLELNDKRRFA
nr:MAG TPA: tail tape measure protein [Caudoviricetes sp.]